MSDYQSDPRVTATSAWKGWSPSKLTLRVPAYTLDEVGDVELLEVPAKLGVCPLCEGRGTHTNPSMDHNGLDTSELTDEEIGDYFRGAYDVQCAHCEGQRVAPEINRENLHGEDLENVERHDDYCEQEWQYGQECAAERRAGC